MCACHLERREMQQPWRSHAGSGRAPEIRPSQPVLQELTKRRNNFSRTQRQQRRRERTVLIRSWISRTGKQCSQKAKESRSGVQSPQIEALKIGRGILVFRKIDRQQQATTAEDLTLRGGDSAPREEKEKERERERIIMADQSVKKKFDTTKMSAEEVKNLGLEDARKPPGQSPGGVLHQQGGAGLSRAGRYPVTLAGLAVVVGLASWAYYRSLNPQEQPPGKSNQALESSHPATAKSPSERH